MVGMVGMVGQFRLISIKNQTTFTRGVGKTGPTTSTTPTTPVADCPMDGSVFDGEDQGEKLGGRTSSVTLSPGISARHPREHVA